MRETTSTTHRTEPYPLILPQNQKLTPRQSKKQKCAPFPLSTHPLIRSLKQAIVKLLQKQKLQEEENISLEIVAKHSVHSIRQEGYAFTQRTTRDLSIFLDQLVNVLTISYERGISQTSYTTKSGITITLVEYQTAPKIFNVTIQAPQEMTELLQKNKPWILHKLKSRKKSFSIHQFDIENYPLDKNNETEQDEALSAGRGWL